MELFNVLSKFTWEVVCEREIDHVAVGVKLANGEVLDQKTVWNGDIYKLVVNKENTGPDVSDEIKSWMFTVDLSNLSSKPIYVFIEGDNISAEGVERPL